MTTAVNRAYSYVKCMLGQSTELTLFIERYSSLSAEMENAARRISLGKITELHGVMIFLKYFFILATSKF